MFFEKRNQLLTEELPSLRRYAYALTGNRQQADELVQDCYLRACSRFHLWRSDNKLRPWLFTIMHNLYVNWIRNNARRTDVMSLEDHEQNMSVKAQQEGVVAVAQLTAQLQQLPPEQRELLLMVSLEGLSYKEVAGIMKIPMGTVMSRLGRARETLRLSMDHTSKTKLKRIK